MDNLISKQAAIDEIMGQPPEPHYPSWYADIIKALPSAQRKGKWIMHIDDLFPVESTMECSKCHHEQSLIIDDNFCPNCGAEMKGEEDETD